MIKVSQILLVLLLMLFPVISMAAYNDASTGLYFPDKLGLLQMGDITDYETEFPGLGISFPYRSDGLTATVYIYDWENDENKSNDITAAFEHALGEITEMENRGHLKNLQVFDRDTWCESLKNRCNSVELKYSLGKKDLVFDGLLLITHIGKHYIKIRITSEDVDEVKKVKNEFLPKLIELVNSNPEEISVDTAIQAVKLFESSPLSEEGKTASAVIAQFASESDDIYMEISLELLP
ncbi:MAG: hypothetical protein OET90_03290, partial [Desulfuromonadales bacterium]|nr:hypothetical protein [Desulfuromonadales bacterium]